MEDFGNNTFDTLLDDNELYNLLKLSIDNLIYIQNSLTSEDITKNWKCILMLNLK